MHRLLLIGLALPVLLFDVARGEDSAVLKKQKMVAEENFNRIHTGAVTKHETRHFFVIGVGAESRLKSLAAMLERQYVAATMALQFDSAAPPWPGKIAIYMVPELSAFKSFVRQVEKRSPRPEETFTAVGLGESPFVAGISNKHIAGFDSLVGHQVVTLILHSRAKFQPLPEWLVTGFAKATSVQGTPVGPRKRAVAKLSLSATAAWNTDVPADARNLVAASFVEYLFYGKGVNAEKLVGAIRPANGQDEKPLEEVWKALDISVEKLDAGWRTWLLKS